MTSADPSTLQARVSMHCADGSIADRIRLCWTRPASSAAVLRGFAEMAAQASRRGLVVQVDEAPPELIGLLALCGLIAPAGPIALGSGGQDLGQVELPEQ